jgi:hypothetical protein
MHYRVVLGGLSQNRVFTRLLSRAGDGLSPRWRLGSVAQKGHGPIGCSIAGNSFSVILFPLKAIELKIN